MSYLYVDSILGYIDYYIGDGIDLFIETMRNGDKLDQNALNTRLKTCQNYVLIDFYEYATRDKVESRLSVVKEMGIQCYFTILFEPNFSKATVSYYSNSELVGTYYLTLTGTDQ